MDPHRNSLFDKICAADKELGALLEENEITVDEDIQSLCYDSLKDIFPGGGRKIIQRSKVWKIIQSSLKSGQTSSCSSSSGSSTANVNRTPEHYQSLLSVEDQPDLNSITPIHAINNKITLNTSRPKYTVYSDADVLAGAKVGDISSEVRNRLVRGTIHSMTSCASHPPFNRLPNSSEMEEMAKALVINYPCLRDAETNHGVLLKQLKRRISNVQPVKKPQGPSLKKKKYDETLKQKESMKVISLVDSNKVQKLAPRCLEDDSNSLLNSDSDDDVGEQIDSPEIMARHYKAIQKELNKKNPNSDVINTYLNKEFQARRDWLKMIPASQRCSELLDAYPCFRDHVEVIEEARRVLLVSGEERCAFMNECVKRLIEEVDLLIYFGINTKGITPPKSPKLSMKITYILKNLSTIFTKQTKAKKPVHLLHEIQDHEDPDVWSSKQMGNVPVLVIDKYFVYVFVGKRILFKTDVSNMKEAAVGFLAAFYLLDFDYPKQNEIGMNILQYFVFNDNNTPQDIAAPFNGMLKAYKQYKSDI